MFADAVEYGIMLESPREACGDGKRPATRENYWVVG